MSLEARHPAYTSMVDSWQIVRDVYAGEEAVKAAGVKYLAPTQAMELDGMTAGADGFKAYERYKLRAFFHDLYKDAVQAYVGMLWAKPATIQLPEKMKNVRSNNGETIQQLLRRINEEQLVSSRVGLLSDLPSTPDVNNVPYLTMYKAEHVCNWDVAEDVNKEMRLNFVVLDESGYMRDAGDPFTWKNETRYRVCSLGDIMNPLDRSAYRTGLFRVSNGAPVFDPTAMTMPTYLGHELDVIPFAFINGTNNLSDVEEPALLGLARMMLSIYRSEADYRQNLFMQGQDTLVTIGGVKMSDGTEPDAPVRTGVGARLDIEATGDAKYIGVSGQGLPEQRTALENDRARAEVRAGQLINARVGDKESGQALKTRLAAQTATLTSIALSGAAGVEKVLKDIAKWMGEDPSKVSVAPNEEFSSTFVTGQDMFQLMEAKNIGLPVSYESIHAYMVDRGVTRKTFEEEFKAVLSEQEKTKVFMNPVQQEQERLRLTKPTTGPKPGGSSTNKDGKN